MELYANAENLERVIIENEMVLVFFGNNSCGVCRDIKPKVKALLQKYPRIQGVYIDADSSIELSAAYNIFSLPAILVFTEGKEAVREARHISLRELEQKLDRYYYLLFEP